jgi:hypothetical protein
MGEWINQEYLAKLNYDEELEAATEIFKAPEIARISDDMIGNSTFELSMEEANELYHFVMAGDIVEIQNWAIQFQKKILV